MLLLFTTVPIKLRIFAGWVGGGWGVGDNQTTGPKLAEAKSIFHHPGAGLGPHLGFLINLVEASVTGGSAALAWRVRCIVLPQLQ